jgi:hypothetical protein
MPNETFHVTFQKRRIPVTWNRYPLYLYLYLSLSLYLTLYLQIGLLTL